MGCPQDAEDIVQDVFLRFWDHADEIDSDHIFSWLCRVTKNLCIDSSRKKREQLIDYKEDDDNGRYVDEVVQDSSANPEQTMIYNDFYETIIRQISKLPEKIRMIVIMRDIQDCSYDVIADSVSLPLNTIKVYLHRGRKMLAERIKFLKNDYKME